MSGGALDNLGAITEKQFFLGHNRIAIFGCDPDCADRFVGSASSRPGYATGGDGALSVHQVANAIYHGSHSVFAHGSKVIDKLRRNVKDRRLDGVVVGYDRAHKIL